MKLSYYLILLISTAFTLPFHPTLADQPAAGFSDLQYEITSCSSSKSTELKDNSIKITAIGNSIKFSQVLNAYCNINRDNLTLKYNKAGSKLEVIELLDPITVSRCVCPLKIVGKIYNLEKGLYKVKFLLDNKYTDQKEIIASHEIEIKHASCADLQSRCSFEFLSGGEDHPEGFGMWHVKLDSAGAYYIVQHVSGKVKEYGTFSLTATENKVLWELVEAANFERLDVPKRHGVPDEAQYTFKIRRHDQQGQVIKIWVNDALKNKKISELIKQIETMILKYSGQRAVLF